MCIQQSPSAAKSESDSDVKTTAGGALVDRFGERSAFWANLTGCIIGLVPTLLSPVQVRPCCRPTVSQSAHMDARQCQSDGSLASAGRLARQPSSRLVLGHALQAQLLHPGCTDSCDP